MAATPGERKWDVTEPADSRLRGPLTAFATVGRCSCRRPGPSDIGPLCRLRWAAVEALAERSEPEEEAVADSVDVLETVGGAPAHPASLVTSAPRTPMAGAFSWTGTGGRNPAVPC